MLEEFWERVHELEHALEELEAEYAVLRFEEGDLVRRIEKYERELAQLKQEIKNMPL